MYMFMYVNTFALYACIYIYDCIYCMCGCPRICCIYEFICVCVCMYVCVGCVCVCVVCVCVCVCVYVCVWWWWCGGVEGFCVEVEVNPFHYPLFVSPLR